MLSSRFQRRAALAALALAMTVAATDAFAIRNRYTNEQNEGFAALFFDAFGRPGFEDDQPIAQAERRPWHRPPHPGYEDRDEGPWAY